MKTVKLNTEKPTDVIFHDEVKIKDDQIIAGEAFGKIYIAIDNLDGKKSFRSLDGVTGACGSYYALALLLFNFLSIKGGKVFVFDSQREFAVWLRGPS